MLRERPGARRAEIPAGAGHPHESQAAGSFELSPRTSAIRPQLYRAPGAPLRPPPHRRHRRPARFPDHAAPCPPGRASARRATAPWTTRAGPPRTSPPRARLTSPQDRTLRCGRTHPSTARKRTSTSSPTSAPVSPQDGPEDLHGDPRAIRRRRAHNAPGHGTDSGHHCSPPGPATASSAAGSPTGRPALLTATPCSISDLTAAPPAWPGLVPASHAWASAPSSPTPPGPRHHRRRAHRPPHPRAAADLPPTSRRLTDALADATAHAALHQPRRLTALPFSPSPLLPAHQAAGIPAQHHSLSPAHAWLRRRSHPLTHDRPPWPPPTPP